MGSLNESAQTQRTVFILFNRYKEEWIIQIYVTTSSIHILIHRIKKKERERNK